MERWQHDLRCERQRCNHRPGSKRAVIRSERNSTPFIVIKVDGSPVDAPLCRSRPIARRQPPYMFAIGLKMFWIPNRVLLLCISRATSVLDIVDCLAFHILILDAAKVDPHVRKLMNEKWSGVKMLE